MSITSDFSGIVLNQDSTATAVLPWRTAPYNAQTIYQTFYLPTNYEMGSSSIEWRYPDLSGFQVMVQIDAGLDYSATLDYTLDYYVIGEGWTNLIHGTQIGCHTDGACWMDIIFPAPIQITSEIAESNMRIGVTGRTTVGGLANVPVTVNPDGTYVFEGEGIAATLVDNIPWPITVNGIKGFLLQNEGHVTFTTQQGVSGLWYVNPTPLLPPTSEAFLSDGATPLFTNATVALNFRVLGLTADHGIDFLGNEYRSCVIQNNGVEASLNNAAVTSTQSVTWMSQPQPSPFAVVSQYLDVRPAEVTPGYSSINLNTNGSFEHDGLGQTPFGWQYSAALSGGGATLRTFLIENGWAAFGAQALRLSSIMPTTSYATVTGPSISVSQGLTYEMIVTWNALSLGVMGTGFFDFGVSFYDSNGILLSTQSLSGQLAGAMGIHTVANSVIAPATAATVVPFIQLNTNGGNSGLHDVYVDGIFFGTGTTSYFDGDTPGSVWFAQPGRSGSAIEVEEAAQDISAIIDGVLVNPATPNVALTVYYSIDDSHQSHNMTDSDWEQKLWSRVPKTYVLTAQQQCMFPTPIRAKYIKLEYSNLQAQTYNPGPFAKPVTYKKFPTWVAEYFIAQMENPTFLSAGVNVQNDALNFAYAYYLDDLDELPANPTPAPSNIIPTLTNYFSQNNAGNLVDTQTLSQINFIMQQFQLPTGSIVGGTHSSLVSQLASNIVNANQLSPVSESTFVNPIDYSGVSSPNRESVILEQTLPVMYFFLTCRHTYKEVSAEFEHHRAYFVGIQDVAFLRANYTTSSDNSQYIESGGDTANSTIMDFALDDDMNWYTY